MDNTTDILNKKEIQKQLHPFFSSIEVVDCIESTNTALKLRSNQLKEGFVLISNMQSTGRGRNARLFHSPSNTGIYMSFFIKPTLLIHEALKITAIASVAIYEAIKLNYSIDSSIKWVNDIYLKDKKIAGILCESSLKPNSPSIDYMIIGIGINVHPQVFPAPLDEVATSIENEVFTFCSRNQLITDILNRFHFHYKSTGNQYLDIYKKHSLILNHMVQVTSPNKSYEAKAIDIDDNGCLIVKKENDELESLHSNEIHIIKK